VTQANLPTHGHVQLALFSLQSSPDRVGSGEEGERVGTMHSKSRHRISNALADTAKVELWLLEELELEQKEVEDIFCRIQARMLVLQAILWPDDEQAEEDEAFDATGRYAPKE